MNRRNMPGALRWVSVTMAAALLASSLALPVNPERVQAASAMDGSKYYELDPNGLTKAIYSDADAIIEQVFVETTVDSDGDGEPDRVGITVYRPKTDPDVQVPVIYEMSPYRAGLRSLTFFNVDVELHPVEGKAGLGLQSTSSGAVMTPNFVEPNHLGVLGNYYVPRGYAVILGNSIGTGPSNGCPTSGDPQETLAAKAVIDWLNGRARAFDAAGNEISGGWSSGDVAMLGTSYNGTLPIAVATTGVDGLRTIMPNAAISSWYDYYRANGAVIAPGGYQGEDASVLAKAVMTRANPEVCDTVMDEIMAGEDRKTGDYNDFWASRDYLPDVKNIKASVFIIHGLGDWNVKTKHFAQLWEEMQKHNIDGRLWLHQGGHGGTGVAAASPWNGIASWRTIEHKWFDYWLYDVPNGIAEQVAPVNVLREDRRTWAAYDGFPDLDAVPITFSLEAASEGRAGGLRLGHSPDGVVLTETFTDDATKRVTTLIANPQAANPNRLAYTTGPLQEPARLSGTPVVSIRGSIDRRVANLTAVLVSYAPSGAATIVSRGWMDPQNLESAAVSVPLTANETYTFRWTMEPKDYVFAKGSRIGLVLLSSDYEYTIRPAPGTQLTVTPALSELTLPLVVANEPALTVTSPDDGHVTSAGYVTVTGTAHNWTGDVSVTVNDDPADVAEDGSFSADVFLDEGANEVVIKAVNELGNATTVTRTVHARWSAPELTNLQPAADVIVEQGDAVLLSFDSEPDLEATYEVVLNGSYWLLNSLPGTPMTETSLGHYEAVYTAPEDALFSGAEVVFYARDAVGNLAQVSAAGNLTVIPALPRPAVTIHAPADGLRTWTDVVTVSGEATADSGITSLKVNGKSVAVAADGSFSTRVILREGANTISVTATAGNGKQTTETVTVHAIWQPPALTDLAPSADVTLGAGETTVFRFTAAPGLTAAYQVVLGGARGSTVGRGTPRGTSMTEVSPGVYEAVYIAPAYTSFTNAAVRFNVADDVGNLIMLTAPGRLSVHPGE